MAPIMARCSTEAAADGNLVVDLGRSLVLVPAASVSRMVRDEIRRRSDALGFTLRYTAVTSWSARGVT
jgi:hypothetical protein